MVFQYQNDTYIAYEAPITYETECGVDAMVDARLEVSEEWLRRGYEEQLPLNLGSFE